MVTDVDSIFSTLYGEISGIRAKDFVSEISRYHRIQASPGYRKAAEFILDTLKKHGIDTKILSFESNGRKKYLEFLSPMGWEATHAILEMVEPRREKLVDYTEHPISLVAFSGGTPKGGVTAEVTYVGPGIEDRNYDGIDVKGKFVLAYGEPRRVFKKAVIERGAIGLIFFRRGVAEQDAIPYRSLWPSADEIYKLVPAFSVSKRTAERIISLIERGERVKVRAEVNVKFFESSLDIITAVLPGEVEEEVVLIAHLCHPKPSANDNASGSGLLLEIACTLKRLMDAGLLKLKRAVRFFWVPEYTGTAALLSEGIKNIGKIRAVINLDMVGEDQSQCGSVLSIVSSPMSVPSFLTFLIESLVERSAKEKLKQFGAVDSLYSFRFKRTPFVWGSDHEVFSCSDFKIPSVALICWPDRYYHSSFDTADKVDPQILKHIGAAVATATIICASSSQEIGLWVLPRVMRGIMSVLGSIEEKALAIKDPKTYRLMYESLDVYEKWALGTLHSILTMFDGEVLKKCVMESETEIKNAISKIRRRFLIVAEGRGWPITDVELTEEEREALEHVYIKKFRGPLPLRYLREHPKDGRALWYLRKIESDDPIISQISEMLNLMDGTKSLYDIYVTLIAEYGKSNLRELIEICNDLEELGLIEKVGKK
ncbi:MAG: DUF4910 domain-containing protein [Candidatus Baldrarchaeia archaeon]